MWLNKLLGWTKFEKAAVIFLISLCIVLLATKLALKHYIKPQITNLTASQNNYIAQGIRGFNSKPATIKLHNTNNYNQRKPFKFNPNTIDSNQLAMLPLPQYIQRNIIKYRKAGGHFKTVNDFKKIYGLTPQMFNQLKTYLILDSPHPTTHNQQTTNNTNWKNVKTNTTYHTPHPLLVELNSADSLALVKLPGIGAKTAMRIIKYRNLLGGFYTVEQLQEVYGLTTENYLLAKPNLTVNTKLIQTLRINFATYDLLAKHPYIKKANAVAILQYRSQNGAYTTITDLITYAVIPDSVFHKAAPYFTIN